jgi:hypothetical protein
MTSSLKKAGSPVDMDDSFVNITFQEERSSETANKGNDSFYDTFVHKASAQYSDPTIFGANALRKLYPNHALVMSSDYGLNILGFPAVYARPLSPSEQVSNLVFIPLARRLGSVPGILADNVEFGGFSVAWKDYDFIVYVARWQIGFSMVVQHFVLHEGPEDVARELILAASIWRDQLHDEIWVFNQGIWKKDPGLWVEIQKADWKDVVLKDEFKKSLKKDIYGFFASETVYKELAIPWKRGLIMYGPPGNGKTITIKVVMKTCGNMGFTPLYVKSFQSYKGEEGAMADVFDKARQLSPCVVVLEDLDSLINDHNRSFFLNQLDGLESNDGLLVIGTTNHFERLDPGLSSRPSRFDRKYLFDDPDREARVLYAKYWQGKLKDNKDISYPDSLVDEIVDSTEKFSFAYLKEAFVSSLVLIAGSEDDKPEFASVLKNQIDILRKQLDKVPENIGAVPSIPAYTPFRRPQQDVRALLSGLSDSFANITLLGTTSNSARGSADAASLPNVIYAAGHHNSADPLPIPGLYPSNTLPR